MRGVVIGVLGVFVLGFGIGAVTVSVPTAGYLVWRSFT